MIHEINVKTGGIKRMKTLDLYNHIKEKYELDKEVGELLVIEEYASVWRKYTSGKRRIAIYGGGENTKALLKLLIRWNEEYKIACIIDNNNADIKTLIPIIKEKDLINFDVELVWISSFNFREEMKQSVTGNFKDIPCIDPYEILYKRIKINRPNDITRFWAENKYKWFSSKLIERQITSDEGLKCSISQKLIAGYFCIYDWISLEKEILQYINRGYKDQEKYQALLLEVKAFIENVKEHLEARKRDSYLIFLVDALSKYVAADMPHLCEWKKNALEFTEYRNDCPATREFVTGMFTGWMPFENQTYRDKSIHFSDSKLLSHLKQNHINIKYMTQNSKHIKNFRNISKYENKKHENTVISEILFNGICELIEDEEAQLVVMHTDTTIHPQHLTPITMFKEYDQVVDMKKKHQEYFDVAVKYTDDILHFYTDLLNNCDNITQIIMGDHGIDIDMEYAYAICPSMYENKAAQWSKKIISPELLIHKKGIQAGINDNLVSSNQFADILLCIIQGKELDNILQYKKVIPLELVPGYDQEWLDVGLKSNNYYLAIGASGCMNKKYMYINLETGEEIFYEIINDRIERIDDEEYINRIVNELGKKEIEKNKFPQNILQQDFFYLHNQIYQKNSMNWK